MNCKILRRPFLIILLIFSGGMVHASKIAPFEIGLTLARTNVGNKIHTLLVKEITGNKVRAVDLSKHFNRYSQYPLDLFNQKIDISYFKKLMADDSKINSYEYQDLIAATSRIKNNIGVALNYSEHSSETGLDKTLVFIFPKRVGLSRPLSSLKVGAKDLIDYEVELCLVFDRDIHDVKDLNAALMGLYLCNDWSERGIVLNKFDKKRPYLAGGFADGKGRAGFFQAGPFLLVLNDSNRALDEINLELSVNNEIRQKERVSKMVLEIPELIKLILKNGPKNQWFYNKKRVSILPKGFISKGMSILTGTPNGVIFRPPSTWFIAKHLIKYFVTGVFGPFYQSGPKDYVVKKYIALMKKEKVFLQPGDYIKATATYLGYTETTLVKGR